MIMKSRGLSTEPWWTLTFTSNSRLQLSLIRIFPELNAQSILGDLYEGHQSILGHLYEGHGQMPYLGPSRPYKPACLLLKRYFSCSCCTIKDHKICISIVTLPGIKIINRLHLSYETISNPLYDLHDLFGQLETSIVASVQSITLALKELCSQSVGTLLSPIMEVTRSWWHLYHLLLRSSLPLSLMGLQPFPDFIYNIYIFNIYSRTSWLELRWLIHRAPRLLNFFHAQLN